MLKLLCVCCSVVVDVKQTSWSQTSQAGKHQTDSLSPKLNLACVFFFFAQLKLVLLEVSARQPQTRLCKRDRRRVEARSAFSLLLGLMKEAL